MTRGCAILLAVASTWPSSQDRATGFLTAPPVQSSAATFRTSMRRSHSFFPRCASWPTAAAFAISTATAVHRRTQHTGWASTAHSSSSPRGSFPSAWSAIQGTRRGASFALGGTARGGGQRN
ncbi:unnamed protein product, partial [Laminaria digitata]